MTLDPLLLSRVRFGSTVSFHVIFPAFTLGLAAWLATMERMQVPIGHKIAWGGGLVGCSSTRARSPESFVTGSGKSHEPGWLSQNWRIR
jgi:hypothetical protein